VSILSINNFVKLVQIKLIFLLRHVIFHFLFLFLFFSLLSQLFHIFSFVIGRLTLPEHIAYDSIRVLLRIYFRILEFFIIMCHNLLI